MPSEIVRGPYFVAVSCGLSTVFILSHRSSVHNLRQLRSRKQALLFERLTNRLARSYRPLGNIGCASVADIRIERRYQRHTVFDIPAATFFVCGYAVDAALSQDRQRVVKYRQ